MQFFLLNQCVHGVNCWYRHDEPMETDTGYSRPKSKFEIKCNVCDKTFEDVASLRKHKKADHLSKGICQQFVKGSCDRGNTCWFEHVMNETDHKTSQEGFMQSDFQFPPLNPIPPEDAQMIMKTLNMVLKKMQVMEEMFQQKKY